jgi:[amino group carrier protein]-L-2-aminoadipate 6-kinase
VPDAQRRLARAPALPRPARRGRAAWLAEHADAVAGDPGADRERGARAPRSASRARQRPELRGSWYGPARQARAARRCGTPGSSSPASGRRAATSTTCPSASCRPRSWRRRRSTTTPRCAAAAAARPVGRRCCGGAPTRLWSLPVDPARAARRSPRWSPTASSRRGTSRACRTWRLPRLREAAAHGEAGPRSRGCWGRWTTSPGTGARCATCSASTTCGRSTSPPPRGAGATTSCRSCSASASSRASTAARASRPLGRRPVRPRLRVDGWWWEEPRPTHARPRACAAAWRASCATSTADGRAPRGARPARPRRCGRRRGGGARVIVVKLGGRDGLDHDAIADDVAAHWAEGEPARAGPRRRRRGHAAGRGARRPAALRHQPQRAHQPLHRPGDARGVHDGRRRRRQQGVGRAPADAGRAGARPLGPRRAAARGAPQAQRAQRRGGKTVVLHGDHTGAVERSTRACCGCCWTPATCRSSRRSPPRTRGWRSTSTATAPPPRSPSRSAADALVLLSNVPGLLRAFPDEASLVARVAAADVEAALGWAQGRMKKKVGAPAAAVRAASAGRSWPTAASRRRCGGRSPGAVPWSPDARHPRGARMNDAAPQTAAPDPPHRRPCSPATPRTRPGLWSPDVVFVRGEGAGSTTPTAAATSTAWRASPSPAWATATSAWPTPSRRRRGG